MIDGCDGCGDGCGEGGDGGRGRSCTGASGCLDTTGCDGPDRRDRRRRRGPLARWALAAPRPGRRPRPLRWWSLPRHLGSAAIYLYQGVVSPRTPPRCRYVPTCSAYGRDAVRTYGLWQGSRLALGRVRRCTRDVPPGTADPLVVDPG
ncbi:putative membrane protein insertion efficiency factor [Isoptericola jiangsuensis]|uniref:Putative membrane protein insertion efficiency factor n=1 Tax=Isoptericola jiangsuensis TaxID=548579 RepID=A0A2A9EWV0_9MICO|nr:membrane protein insertion efficiency factor YidD [Isoptericola jiangsuensis]PFG43056.1 putative membrane protein insertion efficiency factor [Isoptericola jiangsuensis]